ncbi:c-type cytochrome biogenesis protein CcsB [Rhizocola hellebori]|uniref:C-type cytochrome biogenesis protein CcsB n=1 Tax=Rhizocola hellebori TaxID=1392758 RepID=A0A8J3QGX0_9ACTN|nr:c-type cytochrome biogenesis protein CcsB [Rhizocola hellebori]GIH09412.1 c-type cytochrome biogenesis protein CcsB [Rhizocola hellebori]
MAALSDNVLITITVLAYLVAMLLHSADYAFGRQSHIAKAAVRERELVGAGGPPVVEKAGGFLIGQEIKPRAKLSMLQIALGATVLAGAAHLATVVTRALAAERMPWGNMYEFVLTVTLLGTLVWLAVAIVKPEVRHLGLFVVLVQVLLTGVAQIVLQKPIGPLVPALDSYWFVIHVASVATASALFLVGFAASLMYLLRSGYDKGKRGGLYPYGRLFANAETVERLSFRMHAFAFPIWTFGVTAGAIWAEAAWGRYWGWDPKETWAFISWIVYAGYLHARATPSISRRAAAWIAVIGWATMLMNLFGVNIFFEGLHSYGGV